MKGRNKPTLWRPVFFSLRSGQALADGGVCLSPGIGEQGSLCWQSVGVPHAGINRENRLRATLTHMTAVPPGLPERAADTARLRRYIGIETCLSAAQKLNTAGVVRPRNPFDAVMLRNRSGAMIAQTNGQGPHKANGPSCLRTLAVRGPFLGQRSQKWGRHLSCGSRNEFPAFGGPGAGSLRRVVP